MKISYINEKYFAPVDSSPRQKKSKEEVMANVSDILLKEKCRKFKESILNMYETPGTYYMPADEITFWNQLTIFLDEIIIRLDADMNFPQEVRAFGADVRAPGFLKDFCNLKISELKDKDFSLKRNKAEAIIDTFEEASLRLTKDKFSQLGEYIRPLPYTTVENYVNIEREKDWYLRKLHDYGLSRIIKIDAKFHTIRCHDSNHIADDGMHLYIDSYLDPDSFRYSRIFKEQLECHHFIEKIKDFKDEKDRKRYLKELKKLAKDLPSSIEGPLEMFDDMTIERFNDYLDDLSELQFSSPFVVEKLSVCPKVKYEISQDLTRIKEFLETIFEIPVYITFSFYNNHDSFYYKKNKLYDFTV